MVRKLLAFAAVVEIGTALAVLVVPRAVVVLLLGEDVTGIAVAVTRCFGIALLALGLACWPDGPQGSRPAFLAMLVYNAAVALYLAYLFLFRHVDGVLLWPAVALHATVAVLLVVAPRSGQERGTSKT